MISASNIVDMSSETVRPANSHQTGTEEKPQVVHYARFGRKQVVNRKSILVTAQKRSERLLQPTVKIRRVHFKPVKPKRTFTLMRIYDDSEPAIQNWRLFMVIPLTYEVWALPFRFALGFPSVSSRIWYVDILCDVLFWMDAVVAIRTTVPASAAGHHEAMTTFPEIAKHHICRKFPFELLPSFVYLIVTPICAFYLGEACRGGNGPFPALLESVPVKWMVGAVRPEYDIDNGKPSMSQYCFEDWPFWTWWVSTTFRFCPRAWRLSRFMKETEFNLDVSVKTVQIFYISMVIFMTSHWVGCWFFFIARLRYADDTTWLSDMMLLLPGYDSFTSPNSAQYVVCLYNGFSSLTNLGYATFLPNNSGEILFSFIVMVVQVWQTGVIVGTVINYMNERDPVQEAHKKMMEDLHAFMQTKLLPPDLKDRVIRHFEFQHKKAVENQSNYIDLPKSLEIKVANSKYQHVVSGCTARGQIFHGCNPQFLNALLTKLRVVFLMPNEEVFKMKDLSRELGIVFNGACAVMNEDKVKHVVRHDVPEQSSVLGEIPFFFGIVHHFHVRAYADGDVQLLVLNKTDGDELFNNYPEQLEIIRKNILASLGLDEDGNPEAPKADEEQVEDADLIAIKENIREALKCQADETFTSLTHAARSGDLEEVSSLIRHGAQINHVDYDGRGALAMAAVEGNYRIVELLLQEGVDRNVQNRWGQTVLQEAMDAKQGPVVELLLQWKVFINAEQAGSALCSAASIEDVEQLKRLVENKADVDAGDYDSRTALHLAAAEGHARAVEYLLEQRADPNKKDRWGCTSLMEAVRSGRAGVATLIRSKGGTMPEDIGAVHLCAAAGKGDLPSMRILRECGIPSEAGDYDNRFPLHLAAAEGRILAVSFLLGTSSDPNCKDRWGNTPLDDACRGGTLYHKFCGRLILGWGGCYGSTKLTRKAEAFMEEIQAISMDDVRMIISRLIDNGYDKKAPRVMSEQDVRFHFETSVRHVGMVRTLRELMGEAANTLKGRTAFLSKSTERVLRLLRPMCSGVDIHPAKKRKPMSSGWPAAVPENSSGAIAHVSLSLQLSALTSPPQQTAVKEAHAVAGDDGSDCEDNAMALDSDEEAQLHSELDAWIQMQERMEAFGGNQHKYLASVFQKACLHINDIEEMFRDLSKVFRLAASTVDSSPKGVPAVTLHEFAVVSELLKMSVSQCEMEEMFDEGLYLVPVSPSSKTTSATSLGQDPDGRFDNAKVAFTALVAGSEAFRNKIIALDTDEVFCDMNTARSLHFLSESQKRFMAKGGKKRNVAKGEIFLSHNKPQTFEQTVSPTLDSAKDEALDGDDIWMVVLSGTFVVQDDPRHLEERLYSELGPGDVFGGYFDLAGFSTPFTIRVVKGGQILELKKSHLGWLRKESAAVADELAAMMGEAPRSALRPMNPLLFPSVGKGKGVAGMDESWHRPGHAQEHNLTLPETKVHSMKLSFLVIENVWKEVSMGENTISISQLLAIEKHLGEVGSELFKRLIFVDDLPEKISKTQFWDIWMNFLTTEEIPDACDDGISESESNSSESQGSEKLLSALTDSSRPDLIERLHARFAWSRRLKRAFFEDETLERYESAFVSVTGEVGTPMPQESVVAFLEQLFPDFPYRISSYNCDEFLTTFGREGAKSRQVHFSDIRKVLKEYAAQEADGDESILIRGALNPHSPLLQRWMVVVQLLAVYYFIVVPVRIAFLPWPSMVDLRALCTDLPCDVLTLCNLAVLANTAYYNSKAQLVTDRLKIVRHISRNLILASVPADWFGYWCGAPNETCCWLRLPRMLFPFHVFRQLKRHGRTSTAQKLVDLFFAVVALLHVTACGWFYIGREYVVWFPSQGITWYSVQPNFINNTLIDHKSLLGMQIGASVWEKYIVSFYWVGVTLTSYGLVGFVTPQNIVEVIYAITLMILNMTVFRFLIGEVSSIMMMRDEDLARKRAQLGAVENFLRGSSLEGELQQEIQHHFRTSHVRSSADQAAIFRRLSHSLQVEVSSYTSRGYLDGVPLFAGCSSQLLDAVSVLLVEVNFAPEEYLYRTNEIARDMFLTIDGSVDDLIDTEAGERVDVVHKRGSCTGTLSFFFGMRRLGSARAGRHTGAVCLRLSRDEFQALLKLHPEDEERLAQAAMKSVEGARSMMHNSRGGGRSLQRSSQAGSVVNSMASAQEQSGAVGNFSGDDDDDASDLFAQGGAGIRQKVQALRRRRENMRIYGVLQAAMCGDLARLRNVSQGLEDWNIFDHFRRTPLHVAASSGQLDVVAFLLHGKADPALKDRFDNTPLNDAVRHRHDAVAALIRELAPGTVISPKGHEIGNLMCKSAYDGDLEHVKRIITNGGSAFAVDYDRRSALHLASCQGHVDIARYLIEARADIETTDRFGGTPLDDAVRHGHVEVQALLRAHGACLRSGYANRVCAAAATGDLETLRTLVDNGVDTAAGDYDGRTALHLAASEGQVSVLHYLLNQEPPVDINAMDRTGGTPLEDAIRHEHGVVAAMLEEAGGIRRNHQRFRGLVARYLQLKLPDRLDMIWLRRWGAHSERRLESERRAHVDAALAASAEAKALETVKDKALPALYSCLEALCDRISTFVDALDAAGPECLAALGLAPPPPPRQPLVSLDLAMISPPHSPKDDHSKHENFSTPSGPARGGPPPPLPGIPLVTPPVGAMSTGPRRPATAGAQPLASLTSMWAASGALRRSFSARLPSNAADGSGWGTKTADSSTHDTEAANRISKAVGRLMEEVPGLLEEVAAARELLQASLPDLRIVRFASRAYRVEAAALRRELRRAREVLRFLRRVLKSAKPLFRAGTVKAAAAAAVAAASIHGMSHDFGHGHGHGGHGGHGSRRNSSIDRRHAPMRRSLTSAEIAAARLEVRPEWR